MVTKQNLTDVFTYHAPNDEQKVRYNNIRSAAMHLAETILENTPQGADQQAAIRKVREGMMTANASIATNGEA